MALSVDYYFQFSLNLIRKNASGGLSNEEFERLWNDSSISYQADLLGRFQAKNNGKEGANTGVIENETIMQKLAPFIKSEELTISGGATDKPLDFVYRMAMRITDTVLDTFPNEAKKINYNQRTAVMRSVIDAPSIANNIYYFFEYEDYYEFLPEQITLCKLDYVSFPVPIKWGFNYDAQGRQIYNAGTSVQTLWDSTSGLEITKRMLKTIGVSFKDKDFENFGQIVQTTGE